jgi:hypothetical protein
MNAQSLPQGTHIEIPPEVLDESNVNDETDLSFEENMGDIETSDHNIPHSTHFPRNGLHLRNERSRPILGKVDMFLESCCVPFVQSLCRNKLRFFILIQMVVLTIKLIKYIDNFFPAWILLIPIFSLIFFVAVKVCKRSMMRHQNYRRRRQNREYDQLRNDYRLHMRYQLEIMLAEQRFRGIDDNSRDEYRNIIANLFGFDDMRRSRGLSEDEIDGIPLEKYAKTPGLNENENEECSICIDEFKEDQNLRKLGCGHKFHQHCIDQWLVKQPSCPNCKSQVRDHSYINDNGVRNPENVDFDEEVFNFADNNQNNENNNV